MDAQNAQRPSDPPPAAEAPVRPNVRTRRQAKTTFGPGQ
jgi:hypothetical protein